jgi:hypothetical protein
VAAAALAYRPIAMSTGDQLQTALVIAAALAGIAGIAVWSFRSLNRNREAHNRAADQHNAALERIARTLAWQWQPIAGYSHPMAGTYRGWSSVSGMLDGLEVQVSAQSDGGDESPTEMTTAILVKPPRDQAFDLGSARRLKLVRKRGKLEPRGKCRFPVDQLEPVVSRLAVTGQDFTATVASPERFFKSLTWKLGTQPDAEVILRAIEASVHAARALLRVEQEPSRGHGQDRGSLPHRA